MSRVPPTDAEAVVRDYIEMWNDRAYGRLPSIVSDSYVLVDPAAPGGEARGADGAEAWLREIVEGFPDFEIEILDSLADDTTAMVELRYTGTHQGDFQGVPPTGRSVDLRGMERHRVDSGVLQETRVYLDDRELQRQLGLTFPEVVGQLPSLVWQTLRRELG